MKDGKPESFVSRWSRRKRAAARGSGAEPAPSRPPASGPASAIAPGSAIAPASAPAPSAAPERGAGAPALPPVESLTFESDFTPFMQPGVEPATRQAALRTLLRDPRFNTMDGLDVYIDDYTKPAPLDPGVAQRLAAALLTPTRVNEQGYAEDVPADVQAVAQPPASLEPSGQASVTRDAAAVPPDPEVPPRGPVSRGRA